MNLRALTVALFASAALISCQEYAGSHEATEAEPAANSKLATADLKSANGNDIGRVALTRTGDKITLSINAEGIPPGEHGFHLHAIGSCEAPDFKSAGGHLNPDGRSHGKLSTNGQHLGDLPNLTIDESGSASENVELEGNADGIVSAIMDEDGTAVVIHSGPDDYISNPAGDAGPRIACGVLEQ